MRSAPTFTLPFSSSSCDAAHDGADARQQFAGGEGFDRRNRRPALQAADPIVLLAARR
jgi:hypothetical protein